MIKALADVHFARKVTHIFGILVMVAVHSFFPSSVCWTLLLVLGLPLVVLDIVRLKNEKLNALMPQLFGAVMRRRELHHLTGTTYLFLGAATILYFFPKDIVTLSLLFLAFGDPTASYIGVLYGSIKIVGKKSLQGSLAAFVVCCLVAVLFFNFKNLLTDHLFVATLLAGMVGSLSELIPVWKLDDNFTQPVINAIGLSGLFFLFGGF